jgi:hypothetical protein
MTPEIFAPGIVSTGHHEHSAPTFSSNGDEMYWSVFPYFRSPQVILFSRQLHDKWTEPEAAPFSGQYSDGNPSLSADGKKLFFVSNRPLNPNGVTKDDFDIWVVDREADGWGEPWNLGNPVNSSIHEASVSVCENGDIYFTTRGLKDDQSGIFISRYQQGRYSAPQKLTGLFGENVFVGWVYVSPKEEFLIYDLYDHPKSLGSGDLFISFKKESGWTKAKHMGNVINTSVQDRFGGLSHDGKYLFFVNNKPMYPEHFPKPLSYKEILHIQGGPGNGFGDVFWVDAGILERLKPTK